MEEGMVVDEGKPNKAFLSKAAVAASVVAGVAILLLLGYLYVVDNIQLWERRKEPGYTQVQADSCLEIESGDAPLGIRKEYRFTIGEMPGGDTCLAFYTVHQYVEVFIDGQPVYRLKPAEENRIGKTVGSNWVMVPLRPEDMGRELCVEITPVYESFRDREIEFLAGSQLLIYTDRLMKDLPQLLLGILAVFTGFILICVAGYNLFRRKKSEDVATLGLFSVMLGIWRLTDTRFTPFILPGKPVFLFYTSIAMLMVGLIPLIKSMQKRFEPNSSRCLDGCCLAAALVCLIQLLLQAFNVLDLREGLVAPHVVIGLCAGLILGIIVYERIRFPEKSRQRAGRKLPLICAVGVLADVVAFYIKGNSSGLIFSLTAFLLYIVFTGIIKLLSYGEQEKRLKEQEAQLAESRISIMLSQIQPHFLYNSLGVIRELCHKEPKLAEEATIKFTEFLRRNMDALSMDRPIPFQEELAHTKNYLDLEQLRFGEQLSVQFAVETADFRLPTLTLQPLVENAVRHGVRQREEGGTVWVSTREYPDRIEVEIRDDGPGFDPGRTPETGRSHVGIRNVRERLERMCGGALRVESAPGQGTVATMILPKEGITC